MIIKIETSSKNISLAIIKALVKVRNQDIDTNKNFKLSVGLEFPDSELDAVEPIIKILGEMDEIKAQGKVKIKAQGTAYEKS